MQVRLNKGGGFQLQRGQVAQLPVLRRKMQLQKISGNVGIRQNDRNAASCGVGVVVFFFLLTVPPGEMSERILPPAQADSKG
ncbi:hypothetical protein ECZU17_61390 [Escherichia coli]|nr:hypothetical protein ECZU17_61390 [Escherichia coli]